VVVPQNSPRWTCDSKDIMAIKGNVLVIAGSDSGGGAGIQADIKAMQALGAFATTAVTALTAQNTLGVHDIHAPPIEFLVKQIDVVVNDLPPDAVKIGMLANAATVRAVVAAIARHGLRDVVVDTVTRAKGGASLLEDDALCALRDELVPLATVITPNVPEAAALLGIEESAFGASDMSQRARELGALGCAWVLLKGGHVMDDNLHSVDYLYDVKSDQMHTFASERVVTQNTHGTGCTFASAVAAGLAQGMDVPAAVRRAKSYISEAISTNPMFGAGHGPLNHLPYYAASASRGPAFDKRALRLYLVTSEALTLEKLDQALEAGVTMVQMRDKDPSTRALVEKARAMKAVCDKRSVPFLVNDRVDVAIAVDADGVHIGQSDMTCREARQILGASKWIGVSCRTEDLARKAKEDGADYIGCGACFGTNSKGDAKVIGVEGVAFVSRGVCKELNLPIVAIGGIGVDTARGVRDITQVDGVAVISCVANAVDVRATVAALLA
jgi:hydroxymethylpyrimidine kinase / phosphomethylpyrimidine kinase / thiamine-phosphate diphosphorylase